MLDFLPPRRKVEEHVVNPRAGFGRGEHLRPKIVAGDVGPERAAQVLAEKARVGVRDIFAVRVDDEDVPLAVYVVRVVVVRLRRVQAVALVAAEGVLDERDGVGRRVGFRGRGLDGALVPAGSEQQAVVPDDPGMLHFDGAAARGVAVAVVDPLARSCGGDHIRAEFVARVVRSGGARDVHADVVGERRVGDDAVVLVGDEDVPLAVHAFGRVVVGDRRLAALAHIAADRRLHERLGVGAGLGFRRRGLERPLVPAGAEDEPVALHDPGMLGVLAPRLRVEEDVTHPVSVLGGGGEFHAVGVAGDVRSGRDVEADAGGEASLSDDAVVLADDEDVPLAVVAFAGVVVVERGLAPVALVAVNRGLHERLRERARLGLRRGGGGRGGSALRSGGALRSGRACGSLRSRRAAGACGAFRPLLAVRALARPGQKAERHQQNRRNRPMPHFETPPRAPRPGSRRTRALLDADARLLQ